MRVCISPERNIIEVGEIYNAEVSLILCNDEMNFEILLGARVDSSTNIVTGPFIKGRCEKGVGKISIPTDRPGTFSYGGTMTFTRDDGGKKVYPFSGSYTVIARSEERSKSK
jgi:hypothetical protein